MKTNEILTALKLQKNKQTTAFAAKLAMLFEFVKVNQSDIKDAAIVETDLNINDNGKVISAKDMKYNYRESLLHEFEYHNKKVCDLNKQDSVLWNQINDLNNDRRKLLKKNKDVENIDTEIQQLHKEQDACIDTVKELIANELNRLQGIEFDFETMRKGLNLLKGCKILIDTTKGIYSFVVPVQNKFFYALCDLLKLVYVPENKVYQIKKTIVIDTDILKAIKKAMQFVSSDNLRPVFQCICLSFENGYCEVVGTDAHSLYVSQKYSCDNKETEQILIAPISLKKIAAIKKAEEIKIEIIDECNALFNGIEIVLLDQRYVDYKCVIPEYKTYMSFERKDLIQAVKEVEVAANKSTSQVTFHLNGDIKLNAQDVDFCFENNRRLNYLYKDFQDMDIAFNSQLLKTCLNAFEEIELKMYSGSQNTKAVIFTNEKDTALLMPIMLNGSY